MEFYIGSALLSVLFVALIAWDTLVDLFWAIAERRRAKLAEAESTEESAVQSHPPQVREVQERGGTFESLRKRHHRELKPERRTFGGSRVNRSTKARRPFQ